MRGKRRGKWVLRGTGVGDSEVTDSPGAAEGSETECLLDPLTVTQRFPSKNSPPAKNALCTVSPPAFESSKIQPSTQHVADERQPRTEAPAATTANVTAKAYLDVLRATIQPLLGGDISNLRRRAPLSYRREIRPAVQTADGTIKVEHPESDAPLLKGFGNCGRKTKNDARGAQKEQKTWIGALPEEEQSTRKASPLSQETARRDASFTRAEALFVSLPSSCHVCPFGLQPVQAGCWDTSWPCSRLSGKLTCLLQTMESCRSWETLLRVANAPCGSCWWCGDVCASQACEVCSCKKEMLWCRDIEAVVLDTPVHSKASQFSNCPLGTHSQGLSQSVLTLPKQKEHESTETHDALHASSPAVALLDHSNLVPKQSSMSTSLSQKPRHCWRYPLCAVKSRLFFNSEPCAYCEGRLFTNCQLRRINAASRTLRFSRQGGILEGQSQNSETLTLSIDLLRSDPIKERETEKNRDRSPILIRAHGDVYDVSQVLCWHPGGQQCLIKRALREEDSSKDYDFHSKEGRMLWLKFKIGTFVECPAERLRERAEHLKQEQSSV